jgi:hypothetical protein
MERELQRLPIQALGQDDTGGLSSRKITLNEWSRAGTLSRCARRLAGYGNDSRATWVVC